jgi:hypothetical protein
MVKRFVRGNGTARSPRLGSTRRPDAGDWQGWASRPKVAQACGWRRRLEAARRPPRAVHGSVVGVVAAGPRRRWLCFCTRCATQCA